MSHRMDASCSGSGSKPAGHGLKYGVVHIRDRAVNTTALFFAYIMQKFLLHFCKMLDIMLDTAEKSAVFTRLARYKATLLLIKLSGVRIPDAS